MGRLQKKKGFDILIQSFKSIVKNNPHAYLFIAGEDDGEKIKILSMISTLGLSERVFLIGNIRGQDKVDYLANADLFVLPSHNENFGMVYAEALAAGTPIVASTYTPWEEVEEYRCGRWVKNTIEETSIAMLDMLNRNDSDISIKTKKFVKKFSAEKVLK
jgi:glycosyltransferase involved in cell wall biosynthesis